MPKEDVIGEYINKRQHTVRKIERFFKVGYSAHFEILGKVRVRETGYPSQFLIGILKTRYFDKSRRILGIGTDWEDLWECGSVRM